MKLKTKVSIQMSFAQNNGIQYYKVSMYNIQKIFDNK